MRRRHLGYVLLGLVLTASLACGASDSENEDPAPATSPTDPAAGTYLRGPFTSAPGDTALPDVVDPFPPATPMMYFAWSHANLPANEQLTFSLVALDVGTAAAPNTTVASTQVSMPEAGPHHGPVHFSLPRQWPAGSYRVTAVGSSLGPFGTLDFHVGAAPAFLTVGAFCQGWCADLCGRCGDAACTQTCPPRCHAGRDASTSMDGSNPTVALAKTQADLDRCLSDAHAVACPSLMAGQGLPETCRTIQHGP